MTEAWDTNRIQGDGEEAANKAKKGVACEGKKAGERGVLEVR